MILKRIFKFCVFALAIVGVILSCTAPFMVKQNNMKISAVTVAPADTVDEYFQFQSSNIYLPITTYTTSTGYTYNSYTSLSFSFLLNHTPSNYQCYVSAYDINGNLFASLIDFTYATYYNFYLQPIDLAGYYVLGFLWCDSDFDFKPVSFSIGDYTSFRDQTSKFASYVFFNDVNGNSLKLYFCHELFDSDVVLSERTYFYPYSLESTDAYSLGYRDGLVNSEAYAEGYSKGYDYGHDDGFAEGQLDPGAYSFAGLINGAVMAPVRMFKAFFDFNILGFNILNLVLGLITFAVVIVVVKWLLGGR